MTWTVNGEFLGLFFSNVILNGKGLPSCGFFFFFFLNLKSDKVCFSLSTTLRKIVYFEILSYLNLI